MRKYLLLATLAVLTSACSSIRVEKEYITYDCPKPTVCVDEVTYPEINTNADLAKAYVDSLEENQKCRIQIQTLQTCIDESRKIITNKNH